jgi:hypothetical protein
MYLYHHPLLLQTYSPLHQLAQKMQFQYEIISLINYLRPLKLPYEKGVILSLRWRISTPKNIPKQYRIPLIWSILYLEYVCCHFL